jgi:hypothetical protein
MDIESWTESLPMTFFNFKYNYKKLERIKIKEVKVRILVFTHFLVLAFSILKIK